MTRWAQVLARCQGSLLLGLLGSLLCAAGVDAADPTGYFDLADCAQLAGWAYDPDTPTQSLDVHVYEGSTFLAGFPANLPRPDVNQVVGIPGDHGFVFPTPATLKDGQVHTLKVYALNTGSGSNPQLHNSPRSITCLGDTTAIKRADIQDLRDQIDAKLNSCGLSSPYPGWTEQPLAGGTPIRAAHITQLRTALRLFQLPVPYDTQWTDETLTSGVTPIRGIHLLELRQALQGAACITTCPNGTCEAWEDCNSCPDDCGSCGGGGEPCGSCGMYLGEGGSGCPGGTVWIDCTLSPMCNCCSCYPTGWRWNTGDCCCSGQTGQIFKGGEWVTYCL